MFIFVKIFQIMNASKYLIRVGKYIIQFSVLLVVMFGVLILINGNEYLESVITMFSTTRGLVLIGVVFVFSLTYPFFGFTKRRLTFDASKYADEVDNVMQMCGFVKMNDNNEEMIYRAKSVAKKIGLLYEDTIVIKTEDGLSTIDGARKEVVKISMRCDTFITLNK